MYQPICGILLQVLLIYQERYFRTLVSKKQLSLKKHPSSLKNRWRGVLFYYLRVTLRREKATCKWGFHDLQWPRGAA